MNINDKIIYKDQEYIIKRMYDLFLIAEKEETPDVPIKKIIGKENYKNIKILT